MPGSTGHEFYDLRVKATAAVPPAQRSQDVAAFLEAVDIGNAAAALLPPPCAAPTSIPGPFPQHLYQWLSPDPGTEEGRAELLAAAQMVAAPPPSQAAGDAEAAAVLAFLTITYASLPGQPRPLNHPRLSGSERARLLTFLGGPAAIVLTTDTTLEPGPSARSAAQRAQQLQRMRAEGLDVHAGPGGSLVLTQGALEAELLPVGGPPPCELHKVVRALLLASAHATDGTAGEASAARVLRKLAPVLDDPAALAQLGEQLAAAQERCGTAPPRLPTAQELLQLWLRMCVYTGECVPEAEGWPGIQEWATAAARRLAQIDSANPRAWQELARCREWAVNRQRASGAVPPGRFLQQYEEVTQAYRRGLEAATAAGNRYHVAYFSYQLALDGARMGQGCTPAEAAALLREAEAAWAAVKNLLPDEWATMLRRDRATTLAFQELVQAHLRESPQANLSLHAGSKRMPAVTAAACGVAAHCSLLPPPDDALQAWSGAIFGRLRGSIMPRFVSADSRRLAEPSRTCDACGQTSLATRMCSGCGQACYCSRSCQKASWRSHKAACKAAQAARTSCSSKP